MQVTHALAPLLPLAEELDETKVSPGILGFLVFAVLGGAVWLLLKSMNKHMKRVDFDEEAGAAAGARVPRSRASGSADTSSGDAAAAGSSSGGPSSEGSSDGGSSGCD